MPGPATLLLKRLSWARVLWLSKEALERGSAVGRELGPDGRARVLDLLRKSNGRPGNLTPRERDELRKLAMSVWDAAVHPDRH
jgi:hypothetical protein